MQRETDEMNAMALEQTKREEEEARVDGEVRSMVEEAAEPDRDEAITTATAISYVGGACEATSEAVEASLARLKRSRIIHQTTGGLWKPGPAPRQSKRRR